MQKPEGEAETDDKVELVRLRRELAAARAEVMQWQTKYLEERVHSTQVIQALSRPLIQEVNRQRAAQIGNGAVAQ